MFAFGATVAAKARTWSGKVAEKKTICASFGINLRLGIYSHYSRPYLVGITLANHLIYLIIL